MKKAHLLVRTLVASLCCLANASDWSQWRGPANNGVQPDPTGLIDSVGGAELKPLWTSENIPAAQDGGFGSAVVANGKVYLYCSWRTYQDIPNRLLTKRKARGLGLPPDNITPELTEKIEAARQSDEREGVQRKELRAWVKDWIAKNVTPEQKRFIGFANTRLSQGKKAQPLTELLKLVAILDRTFEGQAALDEWFEANNIPKSLRGLVMRQIPTKTSSIEDVILCLNAADGKTLWRKAYPSKAGTWGASSTPCLVEGRLYVIGGKGTAYCLQADTGEEVWQTELKQGNVSSSFTHLDGKLFIAARRLVALEAQSGKLLWEQKAVAGNDSSPVVWQQGGKAYIICGGKRKISCIDPGTGEVLWSTKGAGVSTPAVAGATMVVQHGKGMRVYRVSPTAAEEVVELPLGGSRGGSPVNDGAKAYSTSGKEAVCLNAESGEIIWKSKGVPEQFSSAILADGKLVCLGGKGSLALLDAASGKRLGGAKVGSVQCVSPTLAKGKLYVRTAKGVSCFDLAKQAN